MGPASIALLPGVSTQIWVEAMTLSVRSRGVQASLAKLSSVVYQGQPPCDPKTLGSVWINDARSMRGYAAGRCNVRNLGIHLSRDSWASVMYLEGLNSAKSSGTSQRTDRHHGIVGPKRSHLQCNSYIRTAERPVPCGAYRTFQKPCASPPPGDQAPRRLPGCVVVGNRGRPKLAAPLGRGHAVCVWLQTRGGSRDTQRIFRPSALGGPCGVLTQRLATRHAHVGTPHLGDRHSVGEGGDCPWRDTPSHRGGGRDILTTDDAGVDGLGHGLCVDGRGGGGPQF